MQINKRLWTQYWAAQILDRQKSYCLMLILGIYLLFTTQAISPFPE